MNRTIEERLRDYANTLDDASVILAGKRPAVSDAAVATLDTWEARARRRPMRRLVAAVAVVTVAIAAATTLAVVGHNHTPTRGRPSGTVPRNSTGLRVLFKRTEPNGLVLIARTGLVPVAEAAECPVVPVPRGHLDRFCTNAKAPGVEFQYTANSRTWRATVLDRDVPHASGPSLTPMITLALVREVRPNGVTVEWSGRVTPYLVVLHATDIATVRVNPTSTAATGRDEMKPVIGWVAFAAPDSSPALPFDNKVEGLDTAGHVVATALPWRCC